MSDETKVDSQPGESTTLTEQDLATVRGHVPLKVWLVQGLYFLERAAYYGLSQPLREFTWL